MAKCVNCGKSGLFLKVSASGLCFDCAAVKLSAAETQLTPEQQDAVQLTQTIELQRQKLAELDAQIVAGERKLAHLKEKIAKYQKELIVAPESLEMEAFALYRPKYTFATSEKYKAQLDVIRERQKQMIKDQSAANVPANLTVNGSKAEGKKLLGDMVKLFLRAFNNECDMAVNEVRFNNFERCQARIEKSFETINKLGRVNSIEISNRYKALKLDELALAYEYQCKKQEEKEAIRALKEQQREEARIAREIEAARKEAEKEKQHYQQALAKLHAQFASCKSDEERAAIAAKQNEIIERLDDLTQKMEDIDYRQNNQRAGYVYIISNIGSFGEDVYKIGMTRRLDPMERVYELGDASVPFMFDVHAMIFTEDAPKLEAALHQAFADKRVNGVNTRREYFRVSLDEIKRVVRENHDNTVEFVDVPEAQQYRETLLMRGEQDG